ncbi:MAG: GxxExxY protein [Bacteroidales bacterium]|nr:GxxExxY protein [Bacteroidales bacterium]
MTKTYIKDEYYDLTYAIIGAAMKVHYELGPGFSEYVYQDALAIQFTLDNIPYQKERPLKVHYKGYELKHDYFADFVCYDKIIVEAKATKGIIDENRAQIVNYLRGCKMSRGLLINFGEPKLKIERFAN